MKRLLGISLCLLLTMTFVTSCNTGGKPKETEHTHTFDSNWVSDETDHWHPATCEHVNEISGKAPHVDEDKNDVCDICGYRQKHTHTYASEWTKGETTHYHKNTCGHDDLEKYRQDEAPHVDENNDGLCDVCAYDYGHTHTYAEEWSRTEGGHWHAPTCGHDIPGADLTDHVDADNDGICDDCAYDYDHTHTYDEAWATDANDHWHNVTCGHDIPVKDKNAHVDADGDGDCDVCGFKPEHFHTFETEWSSDANGHFHRANCGHDVRADEQPHIGFEEDGICDTCGYVVFRFYTVSVTLPDDSLSVTAPDGSATSAFLVKEGTDATFKVSLPTRLLLLKAEGATIEGKPVKDGLNHIYTLKVAAVKADAAVTLTIDKTSNVEVIVDNGKQDMEIAKAWTRVTGTITFTAPSSGHYIVYSSSHVGLTGVTFELPDNPYPQDDTSISYDFDVTEAGEITLNYKYFAMSVPEGGKETFTYVIAKIDPDKTLETLEGEGYTMPTNASVKITFTVPEPGLYQISSSYPIVWDGDVTSPHIFSVSADNLTQTLTMNYKKETEATFPFDWKIEKLGGTTPVKLGDTALTAPVDSYCGITFTAPYDGSYYFTLSDPGMSIYQWSGSDAWSSMNQVGSSYTAADLKAGDTVTLYIRTNIFDDTITESIQGVLSVAYIPARVNGSYNALVGVQNIYVSGDYTDGEYSVTLPNGGQISFDGGKTWVGGMDQMTIPAYGSVSYLVKADGADYVAVSIQKITYEYTLTVGENTVTMFPGKDYHVTLTGTDSSDYYTSYILHWTNADITVTYNGRPLASGAVIDNYSANSSTLTITYNGASKAEISFTLEDGYVPPKSDLIVGENALNVTDGLNGNTFLFVAPEAGTYTFSYAAGETNGYAMSATTAENLDFPYVVILRQNESFEFLMGTADSTFSSPKQDIINIVISVQK